MYLLSLGDGRTASRTRSSAPRPEALVKVQERPRLHPPDRRLAAARRDARRRTSTLAAELLADDKERAEHLMLVDLARNDLAQGVRAGQRRGDRVHARRAVQPHHAHRLARRGRLRPEAGADRRVPRDLPGRHALRGAEAAGAARSSTSSSPPSAASTGEWSATSTSPATPTSRSRSAPPPSRTASPACRPAAASSPTRCPRRVPGVAEQGSRPAAGGRGGQRDAAGARLRTATPPDQAPRRLLGRLLRSRSGARPARLRPQTWFTDRRSPSGGPRRRGGRRRLGRGARARGAGARRARPRRGARDRGPGVPGRARRLLGVLLGACIVLSRSRRPRRPARAPPAPRSRRRPGSRASRRCASSSEHTTEVWPWLAVLGGVLSRWPRSPSSSRAWPGPSRVQSRFAARTAGRRRSPS